MNVELLKILLIISGVCHILLVAGSLLIPKLLNWKKELNVLPTLFKQMFWTYAGYILVINLCFGIISIIGTDELLNKSLLAKSICVFIGVYWLTRILIQFFYFDRTSAPKGMIYTLGEIALVLGFLVFTIIYFLAFFYNLS
ncbi:MAG: hypothetical protein K0S32_3474 [Bacteroidetes bacterium]|jgi:hypothetical protein|nr:hypothetical protein [Bacteroidota bacterium]